MTLRMRSAASCRCAGAGARPILRGDDGNAAVEFAFIAPLFVMVFILMIDFGAQMLEGMSLDSAVRSGVEHARQLPNDTAGIQAAVTAAAKTATAPTVTVAQSCECVVGTAVSCSTACGTGEQIRRLVTVTATAPYRTIIPWPDFVAPSQLQSRATLRYQ